MKKFGKILLSIVLCLTVVFSLSACTGLGGQIVVNKNGKSAYEIAVDNGFDGSEQEWLASLKGDKGADGTSGKNGTDLTAEGLFEFAVSKGLYEDTKEGYEKFLKEYCSKISATSSLTVEQVSAVCLNEVVSIYCPIENGVQLGSGVCYKMDRENNIAYIITNYHVVSAETNGTVAPVGTIKIYTYGNETISVSNGVADYGSGAIDATYIGGAAAYDLAVLKVEGDAFAKLSKSPIREIKFANTNSIQAGSSAIAIGNPMGEGISVTSGVVSVDSEDVYVSYAGYTRRIRTMRIDTSINSGNSGGGVFNIKGELIGIANSKYSSSNYENVANAIPASNVKAVCENIIYFYEQKLASTEDDKTVGVHKFIIGFSSIAGELANKYDEIEHTNTKTEQIVVIEVLENSKASEIGIEADDIVVGMIITRADGTVEDISFNRIYEMTETMLTVRPGDKVELKVSRVSETDESTYETITLKPVTIALDGYTEYKNNDNMA